jgi:hypothetical protein
LVGVQFSILISSLSITQLTLSEFFVHRIPRAREVGQSYITSVFTTLWALVWSFILALHIRANLVLSDPSDFDIVIIGPSANPIVLFKSGLGKRPWDVCTDIGSCVAS